MKNINSFNSVILVDENDNAIGICDKQKAHKTPCLHRAFSIFVFNRKENYYFKNAMKTNITLVVYGQILAVVILKAIPN